MRNDMKHRLSGLRLDNTPEASNRHIAEIVREIKSPSAAALPRRTGSIRRIGLAIAASAILLVPVAALAADSAVPGELLYTVKRTTEQVHSLFDSDVQARHRVEEIEVLLERGADPAFVMERVRIVEQQLGAEEAALMERFARAREQAEYRVQSATPRTTDPNRNQGSREEAPTDGSKHANSTTTLADDDGDKTHQGGSDASESPPRTGAPSQGSGGR